MASEGTETPPSHEAETALVLTVDDDCDPYASDGSDGAHSPPHPAMSDEVGEAAVVGVLPDDKAHHDQGGDAVTVLDGAVAEGVCIRAVEQTESSNQQQPQHDDDPTITIE